MLKMREGIDILSDVGGIHNLETAKSVFKLNMDASNLAKLDKISNADALLKIANAISMCEPDSVFVISDSKDDAVYVKEQSLKTGEEKKLEIKGHTIHFDLPEDQGVLWTRHFTSLMRMKISARLLRKNHGLMRIIM